MSTKRVIRRTLKSSQGPLQLLSGCDGRILSLLLSLMVALLVLGLGIAVVLWPVTSTARVAWTQVFASLDSYAARTSVILALLPSGLIVQHALFLHYLRRRQVPAARSQPFGQSRGLEPTARGTDVAQELFFGASALALRYVFPALMTIAVVLLGFHVLRYAHQIFDLAGETWNNAVLAAQLAFAGAYFSVVTNLGQRAIRRDLTTGAALAAPVFLVVGPLLGGVIGFVWLGKDGVDYSHQVVFFAAGLTPLQFAEALATSARRLLGTDQNGAPRRLLPLASLRGLSSDIETRLHEAGIVDAYALAMSDPFQLLRTTPFDRRQIASWMDEALLATFLPQHWQKLQDVGVSGVIDFVVMSDKEIQATAELVGWANADLLKGTSERLRQDAQVALVWATYQLDADSEPDPRTIPPMTRATREELPSPESAGA